MFEKLEVEFDDGAEEYRDATAEESDEGLGGATAYGDDAGLEEVVFAVAELAGAVAHATDPSRRQSIGAADVVFAGTVLEGAATYRVDVELEQDVFDETAGVE